MTSNTHKPTETDQVQRLKSAFAARCAADRPISHSVAVAYRKLIAQQERKNHDSQPAS